MINKCEKEKSQLKTKTTTFTSNRWFFRDRKWNKFRNFWALFLLKLNFKLKNFQVVVWEKTNIVSNQCHLRYYEILSWMVCHKNDLNGRKNETPIKKAFRGGNLALKGEVLLYSQLSMRVNHFSREKNAL